jgi:hypothetical protein
VAVYDIDRRTCPNCGLGTLEPIATIRSRDAIDRILAAMARGPARVAGVTRAAEPETTADPASLAEGNRKPATARAAKQHRVCFSYRASVFVFPIEL